MMWGRRDLLKYSFLASGVSVVPTQHTRVDRAVSGVWNIEDFGAVGDGKHLNTKALQQAIDSCSASGGGTVLVPAGTFLTGSIRLKDNVTLHLSPSAVLLGSQNVADYPSYPFGTRDLDIGGFTVWALVYACGASNIGIEGRGTINGNGSSFPPVPHGQNRDIPTSFRPRLLFMQSCDRVRLRDVTLRDSGCWTAHFALCSEVLVDGISVSSKFFYNEDGLVLDSCNRAVVSNCFIDASDDAIVLKSSFQEPLQHVTVTNCVLTTTCAAIKLGSQSLGGFKDISISNCACYGCALGGFKLEAVDGGDLEDICVSNLTMHEVSAPITMILGNRKEDYGFRGLPSPRPISQLRNVILSNIRATVVARTPEWRVGNTCLITGIPERPISGVLLDNLSFSYPGGGTLEESRRVVEDRPAKYPENTMLGLLPAYAIYLRHAQNITLNNVHLELASEDMRPAMACDDVVDLRVTGFVAAAAKDVPVVRLTDTRSALFQGCSPVGDASVFVDIQGSRGGGIALLNNDLRRVKRTVRRTSSFGGSVQEMGNLLSEGSR